MRKIYKIIPSAILTLVSFMMFSSNVSAAITFSTPGAHTWVAPAGITSVNIKVWGAGGGGTTILQKILPGCCPIPGSGGAGGGLVTATVPVVPGTTYYINVGSGGAGSPSRGDLSGNGGDSWFSSTLAQNAGTIFIKAPGGNGGTLVDTYSSDPARATTNATSIGGSASNSFTTTGATQYTFYQAGNGGDGSAGTAGYGSGRQQAYAVAGRGGNAGGSVGLSGGLGGTGTGTFPGAGGAAASNTSISGFNGASGAVVIDVDTSVPVIPFSFTLSNNGPKTVYVGNSLTELISSTLVSGTSEQVNLFVSSIKIFSGIELLGTTAGPQISNNPFSVSSFTPPSTSNLTLTTLSTTLPSVYIVTVTGTAGSTTASTSFDITVLDDPYKLQMTSSGNQCLVSNLKLTARWNRFIGALSYKVYRSSDGVTFTNIATVNDPGFGTTVSYDDTTGTQGQIYAYRVSAVVGGVEQQHSPEKYQIFPSQDGALCVVLASSCAVTSQTAVNTNPYTVSLASITSGGISPYSYVWSDGSQSVTNTSQTHDFTYTDVAARTRTFSVQVRDSVNAVVNNSCGSVTYTPPPVGPDSVRMWLGPVNAANDKTRSGIAVKYGESVDVKWEFSDPSANITNCTGSINGVDLDNFATNPSEKRYTLSPLVIPKGVHTFRMTCRDNNLPINSSPIPAYVVDSSGNQTGTLMTITVITSKIEEI